VGNDSGQIERRSCEGGLQSVQHTEALFPRGVDIGVYRAKVLRAPEGAKAAGDSLFDFRTYPLELCTSLAGYFSCHA
jgi:hypothetical protein